MIVAWVLLGCSLIGQPILEESAEKVVKIYGAGGVGRLEGFGSGVIIDSEGYILTIHAPLLDAEGLHVVLADGRRFPAELVGLDLPRELAVLKIESAELPAFDLDAVGEVKPGDVVWALTNLYNIAAGAEPISIQRGVVSTVATLAARRGLQEFSYPDPVYVLDAVTNNPGAAGGGVINSQGQLVGIIGKELRNNSTNTWVNFAIPIVQIREFATSVISGKSGPIATQRVRAEIERKALAKTDLRGIRLLPDVLDRTPAFVDGVDKGSLAESAGLKPDDLIVLFEDTLIQSARDVRQAFHSAGPNLPVTLVVIRGEELIKVPLAGISTEPADPSEAGSEGAP